MTIKRVSIIALITVGVVFLLAVSCVAALSDAQGEASGGEVVSEVPVAGDVLSAPTESPLIEVPQVMEARGGNTINDNEVYVLSEPLRLQRGTLGSDKYLCSMVTMENKSPEPVSYNIFYWKLKNPEGFETNTDVFGSENMLGSGDLPSGEKVKGDVCFNFPEMVSGEYTLTLNSMFGSGPSMQWKHTVN